MTRTAESTIDCARRTLLVFQIAEHKYALASGDIAEILPMAELQRPPAAPELLAGFLDLAGDLVPIIRLDSLFGLPAVRIERWTPLVIVRQGGRRLGLLVDAVQGTLAVEPADILPLPAQRVVNGCATGIVRSDDDSISLLSPGRLLLEQEQRAVADLQQSIAQRVGALEGSAE